LGIRLPDGDAYGQGELAIARQAEAERERRAKMINAEGKFQAAQRLADAALIIEQHPVALQSRYLQTLKGERKDEGRGTGTHAII
jgi:hypothetical protein